MHLDPHPSLELVVLDLLQDVNVEGAATDALDEALKEVQRLLVGELSLQLSNLLLLDDGSSNLRASSA